MKEFYRVLLGKKHAYVEECLTGGFIGADFDIREDLSGSLGENLREFSHKFAPGLMAIGKTKIGAGLACGALWTISKRIEVGDIVLCPDGSARYRIGEVSGEYHYVADGNLPHRRNVRWLAHSIERSQMSDALRRSTGVMGTVNGVSRHRDELERLMAGALGRTTIVSEPVDDLVEFALEKHLEDFLVKNWEQTELGKSFDIYREEGEIRGQQYPTDTGPLDILAVSKDKTRLLVVELKKGRASDVVVGQVLRYMGFVKEEIAEEAQSVEGVIIALEDDQRIRRAIGMVPDVTFYRYQLTFKLSKL